MDSSTRLSKTIIFNRTSSRRALQRSLTPRKLLNRDLIIITLLWATWGKRRGTHQLITSLTRLGACSKPKHASELTHSLRILKADQLRKRRTTSTIMDQRRVFTLWITTKSHQGRIIRCFRLVTISARYKGRLWEATWYPSSHRETLATSQHRLRKDLIYRQDVGLPTEW